MTNMTIQPSVSVPPAPDPRQARVVTEDESEAMSQDQTDELLLQAARGWVIVLTRAGGQAVFLPDSDLVRATAATIAPIEQGDLVSLPLTTAG